MKKFLAVLMLTLLFVGVLCADGEVHAFRLKSIVTNDEVSIAEANAASSGGLFILGVTSDDLSSTDAKYLLSEYDIAEHDIEVSFSITQTELVRTVGKINLTATIGNLQLDTDSTKSTTSTTSGTWVQAPGLASYEDAITVVATNADNVVSVEIKYLDASKEVPAQDLGSFTAIWTKNSDLVNYPGLYTADVSLTYTVE